MRLNQELFVILSALRKNMVFEQFLQMLFAFILNKLGILNHHLRLVWVFLRKKKITFLTLLRLKHIRRLLSVVLYYETTYILFEFYLI